MYISTYIYIQYIYILYQFISSCFDKNNIGIQYDEYVWPDSMCHPSF